MDTPRPPNVGPGPVTRRTPARSTFVAALEREKRWADLASLVSIILVVGLLAITDMLANAAEVDAPMRTGMYVAMVGVVLVVCIWQAAAFAAASIVNALSETRAGPQDPEPK